MTIAKSHPVTYAKNITHETQNLRVPYSGVYGLDGIWTRENFMI